MYWPACAACSAPVCSGFFFRPLFCCCVAALVCCWVGTAGSFCRRWRGLRGPPTCAGLEAVSADCSIQSFPLWAPPFARFVSGVKAEQLRRETCRARERRLGIGREKLSARPPFCETKHNTTMLPACTWCGTLLSHRLYTQGEGRCPLHSPPPLQSMPTAGGSAAQEWQERFLVAERVANRIASRHETVKRHKHSYDVA